MCLDNVAFAGIGRKIINLGKGIAGLEVASAASKDVTALGTSVGTLSGARAAAIGLTALGGAITAFSATAGLIAGALSNAQKAAHDPRFAKVLQWSMSGANYGVNAPAGTFPVEVDPAGHIIPRPSTGQLIHDGLHTTLQVNDKTSIGVNTQVPYSRSASRWKPAGSQATTPFEPESRIKSIGKVGVSRDERFCAWWTY